MTPEPASPSTASALATRYLPKGGRAEVVAAAIVVAIILAMILPMPTWLLDFLIALSISVAALMIVMVLQIKESTHLSAFPALLLITTLFRISISIASTRLILLEGEAGHIITAFGEVVVGGNLVVGLVVFLILTAIQFLVITKGSERVAEVGARFTLDALPGKQLAIDMELKANSLTAAEARAQRAALASESQFFGAMDGAMKFVKGDAIAGILIILINLVGGMTVGVAQRGMSAGEAMHVYSILSIGDGLVAQIPAILMSVTAGMLITRVSDRSSDEGTGAVGKELAKQLLAYPRAWMTASVAMLAFGLVPGMPVVTFAVLAAGAMAVGASKLVWQLQDEKETRRGREAEVPEIREFSPIHAFSVRIGSHVGASEAAKRFANTAREVRNRMTLRYGMVLPAIAVETGVRLDAEDVQFCCDDMPLFSTRLRAGFCTVECDPALLATLPGDFEAEGELNVLGRRRFWFEAGLAESVRALGLEVVEFWRHVEDRLDSLMVAKGPRYFGIEQASRLVKWILEKYPEMGRELERTVPVPRLADVLQRLLSERVGIRNVFAIAAALVEWGPRERDPAALSECVRSALGRDICHAYATGNELSAFMLDAEFENVIRSAIRQTAFGDVLDIEQNAVDATLSNFALMFDKVKPPTVPVVLCRQDVRPQVRQLFRERFAALPVIALSEVPQDFKVKLLGVIRE